MRCAGWMGVGLALGGLAPMRGAAEIRLPKMLSAHAVLQRDRPIHVWGWSEPGMCVRVAFHGQQAPACANALGMWSTYLQPEAAGGPYSMTVSATEKVAGGAPSSDAAVVVEDLLVGDVWFASGQSNMEMPLKGFNVDTPVTNSAQEIAAATKPQIRLLRLEKTATTYPLDDVTAVWSRCTPETAAEFSAVAYFFGRELQETQHVPIGLIDSTWGGTPIESWISLQAIAADPGLMPLFGSRATFVAGRAEIPAMLAAEKREDEEAVRQGRPKPRHPWHPAEDASWNPSYLYNGMIAPATPYTVRGFLWYQGETNSGRDRAPLYQREMPAMIRDWRSQWGEGELPFLLVQLASFDSPLEDWGQVRDAQRRSLSVTNTAMAVSYDVGLPQNVHPPDKQTVGHRLALGARALSYGEHLEWSGPLVQSADRIGRTALLSFTHAEGLQAMGAVLGFEVAGSDGVYVPATATIEGTRVRVTSDAVAEPAGIRYGYKGVTPANLRNREGLPAAAFAIEVR